MWQDHSPRGSQLYTWDSWLLNTDGRACMKARGLQRSRWQALTTNWLFWANSSNPERDADSIPLWENSLGCWFSKRPWRRSAGATAVRAGRANINRGDRNAAPPLLLEIYFSMFRLWIIALLRHLITNETTINYSLFTKDAKSDDLRMI